MQFERDMMKNSVIQAVALYVFDLHACMPLLVAVKPTIQYKTLCCALMLRDLWSFASCIKFCADMLFVDVVSCRADRCSAQL